MEIAQEPSWIEVCKFVDYFVRPKISVHDEKRHTVLEKCNYYTFTELNDSFALNNRRSNQFLVLIIKGRMRKYVFIIN